MSTRRRSTRPRTAWVKDASAGVTAAMAMSGLRNLTVSLGVLDEVPPREIISATAPKAVRTLSERRERAFAELMHWSYGAACGVVYGHVGRSRRSHASRSTTRALGFGFVTLALYRSAIAPTLGITFHRRAFSDQLMLALDHALFGLVVERLISTRREEIEFSSDGDAGTGVTPRSPDPNRR